MFSSLSISVQLMLVPIASQIKSRSTEIKERSCSFGARIKTRTPLARPSAKYEATAGKSAARRDKTPPQLAQRIPFVESVQKVKFKCESNCSAEHSNGCDSTWQPAQHFHVDFQRRRDMLIPHVKGSDRKLWVLPAPAPRTLRRTPEASV